MGRLTCFPRMPLRSLGYHQESLQTNGPWAGCQHMRSSPVLEAKDPCKAAVLLSTSSVSSLAEYLRVIASKITGHGLDARVDNEMWHVIHDSSYQPLYHSCRTAEFSSSHREIPGQAVQRADEYRQDGRFPEEGSCTGQHFIPPKIVA